MTITHLLCLALGYLVGGFSVYRGMRDYRTTSMTVTLDPFVTEAIVREAVAGALAQWEDDEEEEVFPGDEWKQGRA